MTSPEHAPASFSRQRFSSGSAPRECSVELREVVSMVRSSATAYPHEGDRGQPATITGWPAQRVSKRARSAVAEEDAALRLVGARGLVDDHHDRLRVHPADPHDRVRELAGNLALLIDGAALGQLQDDLRHR